MVNAYCGGFRDPGLGMIGDAHAGLAQHGKIIGPVANRHGVGSGQPEPLAQFHQRVPLGLAAEDWLTYRAGEQPLLDLEQVGAVLVETDHAADPGGEERETAGDEGGIASPRLHGANEFSAAGRQGDAAVDDIVDDRCRKPLQQRDALTQGRLEGDLAAHGPFGDRRDMILQADKVGEFVDAFLPDHRRIHVGQEQPLDASRPRLNHDIDGMPGERLAQVVRDHAVVGAGRRCERNVDGDAGVENHRLAGSGETGCRGPDGIIAEGWVCRIGNEGCDVSHDGDPRKGHRPRAVLIAGPTASGKSALALDLARDFGGVVINADSMQVYRDLAIITARPSPGEMAMAPHRLYGTVDAAETFSVGRWIAAAQAAIAEAGASGALPILVGGTGLYFKALTEGLSAIPAVPPDIRERVRREAEGVPPAEIHARLAALDPLTASRLRPSDPQRILRALEVFAATGRPLVHWQQAGREGAVLGDHEHRGVFLTVDRTELRAKIDRRFEAMMAAGALAEVEALAARRLDPALPAMRAHGVPGLIAHLRGEASLDDAIARGQRDTRAYAKRQETWFRHQMPGFAALTPGAARQALSRWLASPPAGDAAPFPGGSQA